MQIVNGNTALHYACFNKNETSATSILNLLLQAGSYPALANGDGETPLADLRQRHPSHHAAIALLEQYPDAQKDAEEDRKLRNLMAFLLGMEGGPKGEGMPRDVFWVVQDLLMPTWGPLRRKSAGAAPPLQQG